MRAGMPKRTRLGWRLPGNAQHRAAVRGGASGGRGSAVGPDTRQGGAWRGRGGRPARLGAPLGLRPAEAAPEGRAGSTPGPAAGPSRARASQFPEPGGGSRRRRRRRWWLRWALGWAAGRGARAGGSRAVDRAEGGGLARRAMAAPEPAPRRGREREREDESEDESDILEESPCGRWQKRREQVNQGNMPGIQSTFLAMDTEEGVEVVWNELHFGDRKAFAAHEEKIQAMFEQLALVDHPNIVKLHKYWLDASEARARVIFITEYVSSGSLKQFLKKTKKNHKAMNARAWKRWCTQILSALSFLHACSPPIIHGNLTSDTIFIQHNGLIKIGSVWYRIFSNALPDDLRSPIRAEREELRNLHFFPPEYGEVADGTAVDIFSFGMCALEMAVLEIQANGDTRVTEEAIARARHSLSDPNMREFILSCLARDPAQRPSAHNLLFHRVLFEVHSLKLLAAHCFIQHQYLMPENVVEEKTKAMDLHAVLAEVPRPQRPPMQWRYSEVSFLELDKFLEDVRNGIYPLMNFAAARPLGLPRVLAPPPEEAQKAKTPTPEPFDSETRKVVQMQCNLERSEDKARWHAIGDPRLQARRWLVGGAAASCVPTCPCCSGQRPGSCD
ncbi:nuclear receptor-binding protein 2 isoform X3 [Sciurus carolinensis]|uniref:nuclear receptor-binding protein 2 isoform X3 n=1 Tax=Sciurus carolinensis TaxID=30640 RepID=UPI001FB3891D|nr:nuclear receptor-binding protein 2 isoform X3 [Sciurus carolinensis]